MYFFFFQAEDGIRDKLVTGVQTCALPISRSHANTLAPCSDAIAVSGSRHRDVRQRACARKAVGRDHLEPPECQNQQCDDDQEDYAHRSMPSLPTSIPDIEMRAGDERMLALCLRRYH